MPQHKLARLFEPQSIAVVGASERVGSLGRAVWQVMREETPRLFWRSRHGNAINAFYHDQSDGCLRLPRWRVFWCGLDDFAAIERCVALSGARAPTLLD